ncbi:hypothetical protein [Curtobacterium sp. MCBA15_004]|uniref:hypothetical protein n=1 Tax=Curtobacterium sp. MCBA15_004 TaxID=1898733 RepID=UPI0008DC9CD0|nr:hypothetical protein [Curtobacterium sp. MCBA15_004]WIA95768.1 hypothetical protein QOL16_11680 [Curtobacterium sp. MCBA15_004]
MNSNEATTELRIEALQLAAKHAHEYGADPVELATRFANFLASSHVASPTSDADDELRFVPSRRQQQVLSEREDRDVTVVNITGAHVNLSGGEMAASVRRERAAKQRKQWLRYQARTLGHGE